MVSWNPEDLCKSCAISLNTPWGAQNQQTIVSSQPRLLTGQESSSPSSQTLRALHGLCPSPALFSAKWAPHRVCSEPPPPGLVSAFHPSFSLCPDLPCPYSWDTLTTWPGLPPPWVIIPRTCHSPCWSWNFGIMYDLCTLLKIIDIWC